jgi:hypothetical protein
MRRMFQVFLVLFGFIVIGISLAHLAIGLDAIIGGLGRLLSMVIVGPPHAFFIAMLVVELALPPLVVLTARKVEARA